MTRREFSRNQREQIVDRSKNSRGEICCEKCGLVLAGKPYEIDHIIAEALRPVADGKVRITIAEGQLLGRDCCHRGTDGKTRKDMKAIAKGKRQYDRANGLKPPAQKIRSAGFPSSGRTKKERHSLPPRALFERGSEA